MMSPAKISGDKKRRFLKNFFIAFLVGVVFWYISFSLSGIFFRSTASVADTQWIAFEKATITFSEKECRYSTGEKDLDCRYEESAGAIVLYTNSDEPWMALTRFGQDKLLTSDGLTTFVLKGETVDGQKR